MECSTASTAPRPSVRTRSPPAPVQGFAGDNSQPPSAGTYTAQPSVNGTPLLDPSRKPVVGSWAITKRCDGTACTYEITRSLPGEGDLHGQLTQAVDGWHVIFPTHGFRAKCPITQKVTTVRQRESLVIHFETGGRSAVAHQSNAFQANDCLASFSLRVDWTAALPAF